MRQTPRLLIRLRSTPAVRDHVGPHAAAAQSLGTLGVSNTRGAVGDSALFAAGRRWSSTEVASDPVATQSSAQLGAEQASLHDGGDTVDASACSTEARGGGGGGGGGEGAGEGKTRSIMPGESSSTSTPPTQQMILVHTPKAPPVTVAMPKTTAEAIALNKSIQEQARRSAAAARSSPRMVRGAGAAASKTVNTAVGSTKGWSTTAPAGNEGQAPRTIVVRTPDAMRLKVTVPSTTAEAVATNKSMQDKARMDAAARERIASEILQRSKTVEGRRPLVTRGVGGRGSMTSEHQATSGAPTEMVITPTARARSLKIPVPLTTADAVAMNKAMRSRFSDIRTDAEKGTSGLDSGRVSGWDRATRASGSTAAAGGVPDSGLSRTTSGEGVGRRVEGNPGAPMGTPPTWSGRQARSVDGNVSFDEVILHHSRNLQWSQIIKIWQEIEAQEKEGTKVVLGPQAYQELLTAFIEHPRSAVVANCGRVFDHLVASGIEIKSVMYNLYMKGCSLAKLGTRAVALMESLDRLPGKKFKPNPHFFYNLLIATCAEGLVRESKLYYGFMKDLGFVANNRVFQDLIDMYIASGNIVDALMTFEDTHHAGYKPKDPLANKLAYTCVRHGDTELMHKALDLLQLTTNAVLPLTVQNVLYMASRKRDAELAMKMWVVAQQWSHNFSEVDYSFTVQAFMSAGKDEMALATLVQAFKEGRGVSRKTMTFCAQRLSISNNRLDGAYYTLASLKQKGEPVPVDAVNTVIVACAIRQGIDRCFSTAEALPVVFELQPNLDTYNALMHVLGCARKQENDHASLGIGMSLLDEMDADGVKPNQETFMSLVDVACVSEGFNETVAEDLVGRMTEKYGLSLEQDVVDTLASAFDDRGMTDVAGAWADKTATAEGSSSTSTVGPGRPQQQGLAREGEWPNRGRRTAQDRLRYTGFDDGLIRATGRGGGIRDFNNNGGRGGGSRDAPGGGRYDHVGGRGEGHSSRGTGGGSNVAEGGGGSFRVGGGEGAAGGGGSSGASGWADNYTRR